MVRKHRKSPIQHRVKSHNRRNFPVRSYVRGKGTRSAQPFTRRRMLKPKSFTVNFKYSERKGDGESVIVIARDYREALAEGLEERKDKRTPIEIEIIDPDWGRVFRAIGRGAKRAVELGAKYAIKGAKAVGREAALAIAKSYRELRLKRLIEQAYSPNRAERVVARAKLKTQYPEIYEICSFSK